MRWKLGFGLVLCFLACLGFMAAPIVTGLACDTLPSEGGFVVDGVACEYGCASDGASSAFSSAPEVADFGQPSPTNAALLGHMTLGESTTRRLERKLVELKRVADMNVANLTRLDERCTRLERLLARCIRQLDQQESETLACRRGRRGRRGASCGAYETSHAAELLAGAPCDLDDAS